MAASQGPARQLHPTGRTAWLSTGPGSLRTTGRWAPCACVLKISKGQWRNKDCGMAITPGDCFLTPPSRCLSGNHTRPKAKLKEGLTIYPLPSRQCAGQQGEPDSWLLFLGKILRRAHCAHWPCAKPQEGPQLGAPRVPDDGSQFAETLPHFPQLWPVAGSTLPRTKFAFPSFKTLLAARGPRATRRSVLQ